MRQINLMPWREMRRHEQNRRLLVLSIAAWIVTAGAVGYTHWSYAQRHDAQTERNRFLQAEIDKVNKQIKECNIQNYSIYLTQFPDGKYYLFSYFEYTGEDFEADMKKMAADPTTQKWWKETDPCQFGLENRPEGEWWKSMEEVYSLN